MQETSEIINVLTKLCPRVVVWEGRNAASERASVYEQTVIVRDLIQEYPCERVLFRAPQLYSEFGDAAAVAVAALHVSMQVVWYSLSLSLCVYYMCKVGTRRTCTGKLI